MLCINIMYYQLVPHVIVEASLFSSLLFPLGQCIYYSWLIGMYSYRYYSVFLHIDSISTLSQAFA